MAQCTDCIHYEACLKFADLRVILCGDKADTKCGMFKPTADVVEVVRCKDCRFNTFTQPNGTIHCHVDGNVRFSKQNDFCSKGRRKEQTDG